jgi:hypothetical protein
MRNLALGLRHSFRHLEAGLYDEDPSQCRNDHQNRTEWLTDPEFVQCEADALADLNKTPAPTLTT